MSRVPALLALLLCASVVAAPTDRYYWFVLASFKQLEAAERFVAQAIGETQEALNILPALGPDGLDRHRVAAGPFESWDSANERGPSLLRSFPDAWMVTTDSPPVRGYAPVSTIPFAADAGDQEPVAIAPAADDDDEEPQQEPLAVPEQSDTGFNRLYRQP